MRNWKPFGTAVLALLLSTTISHAASITIPAGASIAVRMTDALDSNTNSAGQTFHATVDSPITLNGNVVVPKGAEAIGRITEVKSSGRFRGRSEISVELTALNFDGKSVAIRTSAHQEDTPSRTTRTAKLAGGGAAVGAIFGLIGGAPWLGTGVGAAAGAVVEVVRGPKPVLIPTESLLLFTLQSPLPLDADTENGRPLQNHD